MSEFGPPPIRNNRRKTRGRLTKEEMREINEHGIVVPSKKPENYEPGLEEHALLWSSGTLAPAFNYRVKAKAGQKSAWNEYLEQRAQAEAEAKAKLNLKTRKNNGKNANGKNNKGKNNKGKNNKGKNNKGNNNGTRRALF